MAERARHEKTFRICRFGFYPNWADDYSLGKAIQGRGQTVPMSFFLPEPATIADKTEPVIEWEETDCLLCGSRKWSQIVEAPDPGADGAGLWFAVVQCQRCGLCFTNPRPSV